MGKNLFCEEARNIFMIDEEVALERVSGLRLNVEEVWQGDRRGRWMGVNKEGGDSKQFL